MILVAIRCVYSECGRAMLGACIYGCGSKAEYVGEHLKCIFEAIAVG